MIIIKEIKNESIADIVKIGGAVNIEGSFQYTNNKTVGDLINSAKGFSSDQLGINAILYRNENGLDNKSISLNLDDKSDLSLKLFDNDIRIKFYV